MPSSMNDGGIGPPFSHKPMNGREVLSFEMNWIRNLARDRHTHTGLLRVVPDPHSSPAAKPNARLKHLNPR